MTDDNFLNLNLIDINIQNPVDESFSDSLTRTGK